MASGVPLSAKAHGASGAWRLQVELSPDNAPSLPVYFKAEGDRFSASESTIKLCFGTTYQIEVKSWPPVIITSAKLQEVVGPRSNEEDLTLTGGEPPLHGSAAKQEDDDKAGSQLAEQQQQKPQGAGYSCHTGIWKCGHKPSKAGARCFLRLHLQLQDIGSIDLPLIVKVYHPQDKARTNGLRLQHIRFIAKPDPQLEAQLMVYSTMYVSLPS